LDIFKGVVTGSVKLYLENLVIKPQDAVPEFLTFLDLDEAVKRPRRGKKSLLSLVSFF
jgi:hypothetical protein